MHLWQYLWQYDSIIVLIILETSACNFIKKETLAQVFSCEFCEISKNTFFTGHLWATASVICYFAFTNGNFNEKVYIRSWNVIILTYLFLHEEH